MDDLQDYMEQRHKIQIFKTLREVWEQIQKPSKLYIVLNPNAKWAIKIHAIYKGGIAIYHEDRDG